VEKNYKGERSALEGWRGVELNGVCSFYHNPSAKADGNPP